jgi:hypothetical protein
MSKRILVSLLFPLATSIASAGELTCAGKITQVIYHAPDAFMIQLDSMNNPVFFCKPNSTSAVPGTTYTTSAETCRALIALFTAGKLAERRLTVMYFDGDDVPASCNGWAQWKWANVRYFHWND